MRLPTALTSGVSAAAALVLLTACGGGDSEESASSSSSSAPSSSSSSPSSSAAATGSSSEEDVQAFCGQAQTVLTDLGTAFGSATGDPTQLPALLQQATTAFASVEPPAEIAGPWASFSDALTQLSATSQSVDLSTPEGVSQFEQQYESLTAAATTSQADVQQYMSANCPAAGAPAPSS